jgi:cytochrome c553
MRRSHSKLTALATALLFGVFMAACEGAQGPAGEDGTDGTDGVAGTDGQDANENCVQCHFEDTDLVAKQVQYLNSVHYTGGHFELGSYSATCAGCHSHEGFIDRMESGLEFAASTVDNPTPQNCRTCHKIHTTYTAADFDRQYNEPHDLWLTGTTVDFGDGNLCARCHQPRTSYAIPVVGGGDVTISSTRFGPHHGPQSTMLQGDAGYEVAGSLTYPSTPASHGQVAVNTKGCPTCHMATAFGNQAGGHTMEMWYNFFGTDSPNTAGCETCHATADTWTDFDNGGVQTTVEGLLAQLRAELIAAGITTSEDSVHAVEGTYPEAVAGAWWNYISVIEDRSMGVHNPAYIIALLTNALEALTFVEQNWNTADIVAGATLYDKWWAVNGVAEPTTDFDPIWASQSTNTRSGSDTWRCKECHGWDYIGNLGRYSTGSHFTGFAGVWSLRDTDSTTVFWALKGEGGDHDMSAVLSDTDVLNLTRFIADGLVDMSLYMDTTTGLATGNAIAGQVLYDAACPACHGADGLTLDFDSDPGIQGVGWLSLDNPQETLHKIRWGHPGTAMPSQVGAGLTDQQTGDILAYCQTLPSVP